MRIQVRLFAELRRLAGAEGVELDLPSPATVADVVEAVRTKVPDLRRYRGSTLVARGLEFAEPSDPVAEGDEVSLMPPVMGG